MGLDITAYSKMQTAEPHQYNDDCWENGHVHTYAYDSFPASFRGIPAVGTATGISGQSNFIEGPCYMRTEETQTHGQAPTRATAHGATTYAASSTQTPNQTSRSTN